MTSSRHAKWGRFNLWRRALDLPTGAGGEAWSWQNLWSSSIIPVYRFYFFFLSFSLFSLTKTLTNTHGYLYHSEQSGFISKGILQLELSRRINQWSPTFQHPSYRLINFPIPVLLLPPFFYFCLTQFCSFLLTCFLYYSPPIQFPLFHLKISNQLSLSSRISYLLFTIFFSFFLFPSSSKNLHGNLLQLSCSLSPSLSPFLLSLPSLPSLRRENPTVFPLSTAKPTFTQLGKNNLP